ncbi:beta-glucosidase family protein [Urechidicola croceus]|uniref:Glycosyl hydrolase n=1 Tax=Urechidicola croceus TaxID=1850246 RepID=A0A1D8P5F2_9FLAO|nr:glycoside hydrolase family 3 protein [Urechidicola croceus]AOW19800.1 glycosyl hydrolase [Urechidicola croceus]
MKKIIICLFISLAIQLNAQITDDKLNEIIEQLSIEEKVYLVVGTGMNIPGFSEESNAPQAIVGTTQDKIPGAAGTSYTNKKLGFPAVVFADGPAGIRISPIREEYPNQTFYATAFPIGTSISSSWNVELAKEVGAAFGREGKEYGVDFLLAPALNIQRNPLGGRNFEYYSEDPVLGGKITAGFVNGVQSEGIGATIKHFVANNSETNRTELNTVVSERALREIYLKGFEIAVKESQPWSVMSSYNKINGVYTSESEDLLTKILRDEWNFNGFVMTDWFGGKDAVAQMKAGNDLLMPGSNQQSKSILEALKNGDLSEVVLNRNVKYILRQYFKTPSFKKYVPTGKPDLEAHKIISRNAAAEGMILLNNDNNTLPLKRETKIALFGVTSVETIAGGTGSGDVNKAYMISVNEGLKNANFILDKVVESDYELFIKEEKAKIPPKKMFFEKDVLVQDKVWSKESLKVIADNNDVAIFTLGRTSGEFQDRVVDGDFNLTMNELVLIKNISEVFHAKNKKFIVILNIGGVIETQSWKHYADAILLTWQAGQETGNAIADIISGKINPSGKLPVTFPMSLENVASSKNFPGKVIDPNGPKPNNPLFGVPAEEIYEEGIYVGYRYFDSFDIDVSYPFGYGLSYTNFEYSNINIIKNSDEIFIECTIKNIGNFNGKEVAQLYVKSPKGNLEKPKKELKGFVKTKLLNIGESQKITIKTSVNDLGYYDTVSNSWKLDEGNYIFYVSSNSELMKLHITVPLKGKIIEKNKKLLSPIDQIQELEKK